MLLGSFSLEEWKYCGAGRGVISMFIATVPVLLMLSSFEFLIFEFVQGTIQAVLAQFLLGFCFCFAGGAFYPLNFFPYIIQKIGEFLPVGKAILLLDSSLSSQVILTQRIDFTALFFCIPPPISPNGTLPVISSYTIAPNDQMSLALVGVGCLLKRSGPI